MRMFKITSTNTVCEGDLHDSLRSLRASKDSSANIDALFQKDNNEIHTSKRDLLSISSSNNITIPTSIETIQITNHLLREIQIALSRAKSIQDFIGKLCETEEFRYKTLSKANINFSRFETDNSSLLKIRRLFIEQNSAYYRSFCSFQNILSNLKNQYDTTDRSRREELEKLLNAENTSKALSKKLISTESKFASITPKATLCSNAITELVSSSGSINTVRTAKSKISVFFSSRKVSPQEELDTIREKLSDLAMKHSEHTKKISLEKESFLEKQLPALLKRLRNMAEEISLISLRELYSAIDTTGQSCCSALEHCITGVELAPCLSRIIHVIEQLGGLTAFNLYGTASNIDSPILSNLSQLLKRSLNDFFPKDIFIESFFDKSTAILTQRSKKTESFIKPFKEIVNAATKSNHSLASTLFLHLNRVSRQSSTNGTSSNDLAVIFLPLLTDADECTDQKTDVIRILIEDAEKLFCN